MHKILDATNEVQVLSNAKTVAKNYQKLHERLKQSKKT